MVDYITMISSVALLFISLYACVQQKKKQVQK